MLSREPRSARCCAPWTAPPFPLGRRRAWPKNGGTRPTQRRGGCARWRMPRLPGARGGVLGGLLGSPQRPGEVLRRLQGETRGRQMRSAAVAWHTPFWGERSESEAGNKMGRLAGLGSPSVPLRGPLCGTIVPSILGWARSPGPVGARRAPQGQRAAGARHPCALAGCETPQSSGTLYRLPDSAAGTPTAPPYTQISAGARGEQQARPARRQRRR